MSPETPLHQGFPVRAPPAPPFRRSGQCNHGEEPRVRRKVLMSGALGVAAVVITAQPAFAQTETTASDVQVNLDNVFVLLAAVLVIFMQAGFALVEAGLTRAKSVANIMMKNLMDFCAGVIAFFAVGYAIAFGEGNDLFGHKGWFLGDGAFRVRQPHGAGDLRLPGRLRRHRGHDRVGRHGRAHEVQELLRLQLHHLGAHLPGRRALAMGRRLALADGHAVPRLRRVHDRPHDRRHRGPRRRRDPRPPHRPLRRRRPAQADPRPLIPYAVLGHLRAPRRLVRLQPRFRAGRRRRHRRHRRHDDHRRLQRGPSLRC